MAIRKKTSTTRLPQSLLQQIEESSAHDHPQKFHRPRSLSRKDARKQERASRKQRKTEYFSHASGKRPVEEEHKESPQRKRPRHNPDPIAPKAATTAQTFKRPIEQRRDEKAASSRTTAHTSKPRPRPVEKGSRKPAVANFKVRKEEEEDNYIAYLESKLGVGKPGKQKKGTGVEDEGLGDLVDWADSVVTSLRIQPQPEDIEDEVSASDGSRDGFDSESSGNYADGEEWNGISRGSPEPETAPHEDGEPEEAGAQKPAPTGSYVPPHLRELQQRDDSNSETILKLTRQLKGLLNRMSEQNIGSIITSIEKVFGEYRRNDVTSTLTTLIINGVSSHSMLLDSYVVLYATFVASLHKIIGVEFAAHIVQSTVVAYEGHFNEIQGSIILVEEGAEKDGKECSNLLVLIAELYNFHVISSVLVFDIIRALLDKELTEFKVELLLKIMRGSGQQLRQDDPSALKDIIQIVQGKLTSKDEGISSRTRFMVETLTDLKNSKLKRNVTQNQGGAAVERMKKFLSGLSKTRHVLAHDPLRVSLEDLHSAESKGKWWLVGAAWGGNPLVDKQADFTRAKKGVAKDYEVVPDDSADLVNLARAQGMNTEIRRGIFVVLMSSADYIDACERLSQLNLTEVQQREIIRVLLYCCGNERSYNPYYALVCQQLCRTSHAYKITLQYSLWDFLRDLGETNVGGAAVVKNLGEGDGFDLKDISEIRLRNIARAYGWWIAKNSVTLAILKLLDFTILKPATRDFLRELFAEILVNSQRSAPITSDVRKATFTHNRNAVEEIFTKASGTQGLAMGLVYFLTETFHERPGSDDGFAKFLRWAVGVATDTLRTGVDLLPTI